MCLFHELAFSFDKYNKEKITEKNSFILFIADFILYSLLKSYSDGKIYSYYEFPQLF